GWSVDPLGDAAELSSLREGAPHGRRALIVSGTGAPQRGFVRVVSQETHEVRPDGVYELRGKLRNDGFEVAGYQILWLRRAEGGLRLAEVSTAQLVRSRGTFSNVDVTVNVPPLSGADVCQVAIIGWGGGGGRSLAADEVVLLEKEGAAPEPVAITLASTVGHDRDLTLTFRDDSTLVLQKGRTVISRNVRIATFDEHRALFGQSLTLTSETPVRDASGMVVTGASYPDANDAAIIQLRAQPLADAVKLSYQDLSSRASNRAWVLTLEGGAVELPATLYSANSAVESGVPLRSLEGRVGDELILGERKNQIVFSFGQPLTLHIVGEKQTGTQPALAFVAPSGFEGGGLDVYISTSNRREEARIASVLDEVERFRHDDRHGSAAAALDAVVEEFPWRDDLRERATEIRAEIDRLAQRRLEDLRSIRSDLAKYKAPPIRAHFEQRLREFREAFGGLPVVRDAESILSAVEADSASSSLRRTAARAEDLVQRARTLFDAEQNALSRIYCERVIAEFDGTESARRARELIQLIEARQ
ncbi:MAG: hypothetical protein KDC38_15145, partial [Planctomycetes bacterium]|nr:hypothetical protein [Planctomycetota bacterium]